VHLPVVVEVVPDVHVGVDVAGEHRQSGQVVDAVAPAGAARHDLRDSPVAHDQIAILEHPAAPVKDARRPEHRRLAGWLARRRISPRSDPGDAHQQSGEQAGAHGASERITHGLGSRSGVTGREWSAPPATRVVLERYHRLDPRASRRRGDLLEFWY